MVKMQLQSNEGLSGPISTSARPVTSTCDDMHAAPPPYVSSYLPTLQCVVHYKSDLLLTLETIFYALPLVLGGSPLTLSLLSLALSLPQTTMHPHLLSCQE